MKPENKFYCDAEDNNMVPCDEQCYYCMKKEIQNKTNATKTDNKTI